LQHLLSALAGLPPAVYVFVIAMVPVIELRGAIPIGIGMGLDPAQAIILSLIGNLVPIPFILLLLMPIRRIAGDWPVVGPILRWAERRALRRRDKVELYGCWGLVLFVGVPLPMTGAWTGAFVALLINMPPARAMWAITVGVMLAGGVIGVLSTLAWTMLR
jgi:uncharacterized membrane protein